MVAVPLAFAATNSLRSKPVPAPNQNHIAEVVVTPPAPPPTRTQITNATLSPAVERMLKELPGTLDSINATVRKKQARRS
jgi:hypothetical protein